MKLFTCRLFDPRNTRGFKTFLCSAIAALALLSVVTPVQVVHAETGQTNAQAPDASVSVNINTGSTEELASALIGVGTEKAQAIVDYRKEHGPFTDKSQLANVKGIGEATLKKNLSVIDI